MRYLPLLGKKSNDVLDLAKVEAGKMTFYPEVVDLEKLVSEVRDILRTLVANKHMHIEVMVDPTLTGVMVDSSKFKQILYNYLSNASSSPRMRDR
jgi:signal transduction histidine kinase